MPVTDAEPRFRLVDSGGTIIGSVYAEADGTLKLQEGSGSNNEAELQPDGTLSVPAVSTASLNGINYLPRDRIDASTELDTSTPATNYTSVTISAVPSDASQALIQLISAGSGASSLHSISAREAGSSREEDLEARGWAGHGDLDAISTGLVPLDGSDQIEYQTSESDRAIIRTLGYM